MKTMINFDRNRVSLEDQNKHPNFISTNGEFNLVKCYACNVDNWGPAVTTGRCMWCGWYSKQEPMK